MDNIKAALKWIYDWLTVITAWIVGLPAILFDLIQNLGAVDYSPWIGSEKALWIVTAVAVIKALVATFKRPT